jgi:signal transduction histidine kinase
VSLVWLAILAWGLEVQGKLLADHWLRLIPWIILLALVNLLPLDGWHAHMAPDLPIAAAAALILSPIQASVVGFLSGFDSKEFKGQVTPSRAVFNRSQLGLVYYVGSWLAHIVTSRTTEPRLILPLTFLSLGVMCVINYALVGLGITIEHGYPFKNVVARLRVGTSVDFALAFVASAVLAAMLAALYEDIHSWVLLAILGPTLLGRQALMRSQMFVDTSRAYRSREQALHQLTQQASEERSDERRLIAADLHDEVLQPLFKVTLMAHVLKADLSSGRLLDMDQDLPELIAAAEAASTLLRELIGDLRRSAIGRGGLAPALERLAHSVSGGTETGHIHVNVALVSTDAVTELSLYQIAKEALSNALAHSQARNVWIDLVEEQTMLLLTVTDDGIGFDPLLDRAGHFGIAIMRERASAVGAQFFVDSSPNRGCKISVSLPRQVL